MLNNDNNDLRYHNIFRFEAPLPLEPWEGVREASVPPAACPQPPSSPITPLNISKTNEDCLYLDIFSPPLKKTLYSDQGFTTEGYPASSSSAGYLEQDEPVSRYPVIIWIHPGGFQFNSNDQVFTSPCSFLGFWYLHHLLFNFKNKLQYLFYIFRLIMPLWWFTVGLL